MSFSSQDISFSSWLQEVSSVIDLAHQKNLQNFYYTKGSFSFYGQLSSHPHQGFSQHPFLTPSSLPSSFSNPFQNSFQNLSQYPSFPSSWPHYSPSFKPHSMTFSYETAPSSQGPCHNVHHNVQQAQPFHPPFLQEKNLEQPESNSIEEKLEKGKPIVCPLVGTVYLAPREGADPFIKIGDKVKKDQPLFIVEAMKIMNPIKAPFGGIVLSIEAKNASPVEFNEVLAYILPEE